MAPSKYSGAFPICSLRKEAERELSKFTELERAFYNNEVNREEYLPSQKDGRTFVTLCSCFTRLGELISSLRSLDCLQGIEKSISGSVAKSKRLSSSESNQLFRSSSNVYHETI